MTEGYPPPGDEYSLHDRYDLPTEKAAGRASPHLHVGVKWVEASSAFVTTLVLSTPYPDEESVTPAGEKPHGVKLATMDKDTLIARTGGQGAIVETGGGLIFTPTLGPQIVIDALKNGGFIVPSDHMRLEAHIERIRRQAEKSLKRPVSAARHGRQ